MRLGLGLITLAVSAGLLAAALFLLVRPGEDDRVTGRIALVGDSLNVGIEPYVESELDGWTVTAANLVGRRTEDGLAELRSASVRRADVVVVSLGTNDLQSDAAGFRRSVQTALALVGPRPCVIWSTIYLGGPNESFNDVLREAAERFPNLRLDEWATLVSEHPELLAPDGVHGTADGYARRAEAVARLARGCIPRSDPAP